MAEVLLRYHLPRVGLLETTLHEESADIYNFLLPHGDIERLKTLDHLGLVRRAVESAHHPRWEYVVLILRLINLVKYSAPEAHLSSEVDLANGVKISSGQELLNSWALLLNLGHIPWTFTAERALLQEVRSDTVLRRQLLDSIMDGPLRRHARRIIRNEVVYQFYHVLASFHLSRFASADASASKWADIFQQFCITHQPGSKLCNLVEVYRTLRTIAYLALDPGYTPALFGVDINEIFTNPRTLADILYYGHKHFADVIAAVQDHLYETVYLSPSMGRCTCGVLGSLREQIRHSAANGIDSVVLGLVTGELQRNVIDNTSQIKHVLRLSFKVEEPFTTFFLPLVRPISEEGAWCAKRQSRQTFVTIWPFADNRQKVIDFFVRNDATPEIVQLQLRKAVEGVTKLHKRHVAEHRLLSDDLIQELLYDNLAFSIIRSFLGLVFHSPVRWEFVDVFGRKTNLTGISESKKLVLKRFSQEIRRCSRTHRSRAVELKALRACIAGERGHAYILPYCTVVGYDPAGINVAEFDGMYVVASYRKLKLVIVEAKDVARRAQSRITRQLERCLERLQLAPEWGHTVEFFPASRGLPAFSKVTLLLVEPAR